VPESATQTSGPSLEQILWRSMDRWREEPALLDAEEFAEHIARSFEVPEETFADRFFGDVDRLHQRPKSQAEMVVRRAEQRLHAYEFDLNRLEYVIVEEKERLVVVSEFGQFVLRRDDVVSRALEAAVVKAPERGGGEPRGYLVRKSGELVGVDVNKVARTLERLIVQQVSAPAVEAPAKRLAAFSPVRRAMSAVREERALRQDPLLSDPAPLPPARPIEAQALPTGLILSMPDGSLARARIGSAHRWEQMLGQHARASAQSLSIETGNVVAVINGVVRGSAGERALAQGDAVATVRSAGAPVRALAGDGLARALVSGARVLPAAGEGERFWIQPEKAFLPDAAEAPPKAMVAAPLQLGQITGDPWADWALTASGARMRTALRAALDRTESVATQPVAPVLSGLRPLQLAGGPAVGFRAPDGTILESRAAEPVRLAAVDRRDAPVAPPASADPLPRTGAVPFTALRALHMALERTAAAGAYRLPLARLDSAPDAIGAGAALRLDPHDDRRGTVRLAGPAAAAAGTARLVLSMPFPNRGEVHVGSDLAAALDTWLGAPAVPAAPGAIPLDLRRREPAGSTAPPQAFRALHGRALRSAQDAVQTLDLPGVRPLLGGDPSISGLPFLLHRAVVQSGEWSAAPGVALPSGIRELALRAPFAGELEIPLAAARRPLGPGEDEIVIPLPLWAQMGRGAVSETDRIMAAPLAGRGYAPPLGVYRLLVPEGGPFDLSESAAPETAAIDLSGPTGLRLASLPSSTASATTLGGAHFLGRVPLDAGGRSGRGRSRIRIGAPVQGIDLSGLVSNAPASGATEPAAPASRPSAPERVAAKVARGVVSKALPAPTPGAGPAISPAASVVTDTARPSGAAVSESLVTGLPPGMWSGHRPTATADHQPWTYSWRHRDEPQAVGGVVLSGLSRPACPQLPIALRFRYVGAPLWWSTGARPAPFESDGETPTPSGAMVLGLRAANSAASIWRSILVASAGQEDVTGGMDSGLERSADAMSSVVRQLDAPPAPPVVASPEPSGSAPAYIAMSSSGRAGPISGTAAARARAQAVEMSIVAAIPPAPPPLESMSSATRGAGAPHSRGKGNGDHAFQGQAKDTDDVVSHSKIEGSVDAIAQRIYHRIRRRIQSDRERFGG
jgi:hypothetical protein